MSYSKQSTLIEEEVKRIGEDDFLNSYEKFIEGILQEEKLSKKEKILILLGIYASKGWIGYVKDFLTEQIKQTDIKGDEVIEALETVVLSRGPTPLLDGNRAFHPFLKRENTGRVAEGKAPKTTHEILDYFKSRFKDIPAWIEVMGQQFPPVLENYYSMRSNALEGGSLPRRIKELILVGVNAAGLYHEGMKIHMNGALQSGASKEEILETLLVSILGGGIVSWIDGISVMKEAGIL